MGNKPYSTDMKEMNGNAQIIEGVLADAGAIGYVGVGYIVDKTTGKPMKGLKVLNISKDAKAQAFSPLDKAAVDSGEYPDRPAALDGHERQAQGRTPPRSSSVSIGPEGQKIVEREGFYPVGAKLQRTELEELK